MLWVYEQWDQKKDKDEIALPELLIIFYPDQSVYLNNDFLDISNEHKST